eukprot:4024926-Prymnesium_polylepis.1
MDLKGRVPAELQHSGARLRVWYDEEEEKMCYTGHVTSYVPGRGMRVWFDGFSANEQEWVDGNDEWEWEKEADEAAEPTGSSNGHVPAGGAFARVRLKLRQQPGGKVLSISLPAAGARSGA